MFVQHKNRRKATICPNCEAILNPDANFCSVCGQENHEPTHISIGHLLYETIEGIWHFDSKFWTTFKSIFTKPGQLSLDFLEGRRARYVPPIRLYIFVSAFFFWFISKSINHSSFMQGVEEGFEASLFDMTDDELKQQTTHKAGVDRLLTSFFESKQKIAILSDSATAHLPLSQRDRAYMSKLADEFVNYLQKRAITINKKYLDEAKTEELDEIRQDTLIWSKSNGQWEVKRYGVMGRIVMDSATVAKIKAYTASQVDSMIAVANPKNTPFYKRIPLRLFLKSYTNISKNENNIGGVIQKSIKSGSVAMFILMPLVAFLLWLFFRKKYHYYAQHIVVSVYTHAAAYLLLVFFFAAEYLPEELTKNYFLHLSLLLAVWLYVGASFKRTYQQSWKQIIVKYFTISLLYFPILAILMVGLLGFNMIFG